MAKLRAYRIHAGIFAILPYFNFLTGLLIQCEALNRVVIGGPIRSTTYSVCISNEKRIAMRDIPFERLLMGLANVM